MSQRIINNTFSITAYIGSKTYVTSLVVDQGKLHQFYDKDGNDGVGQCSPDWTVASNQPKFHAECRDTNGNPVGIETTEPIKLYYNNSVIEFSDTASSGFYISKGTFAGMFKYQDVNYVRYFYITKNVATAGNIDNDSIRIEGKILTEGNNLEQISTPESTIHVIPVASGGSAYFVEIDAPAIQNGANKTTITAHVYKSDGSGEITSDVSFEWQKLEGETYKNVGSAQSLEVAESSVNGFEHYRCKVTIGSVVVYGACSVFDYNDGIYIITEISGVGNLKNMRSTEEATIKASVVDKNGNEISGYNNKLQFTLLSKSGGTKQTFKNNDNTIKLTHATILSTYEGQVNGFITIEA